MKQLNIRTLPSRVVLSAVGALALSMMAGSGARADSTFSFSFSGGGTGTVTAPVTAGVPASPLSSATFDLGGLTFTLADAVVAGASSLTFGGAGFSDLEYLGLAGGGTLDITGLGYDFFGPTGAETTGTIGNIAAVPEPAALSILALGLGVLAVARRRA